MIINRCVYIVGIGRCHVLQYGEEVEIAVMETNNPHIVSHAYDVYVGRIPGRVLWSVRFTEKEAA